VQWNVDRHHHFTKILRKFRCFVWWWGSCDVFEQQSLPVLIYDMSAKTISMFYCIPMLLHRKKRFPAVTLTSHNLQNGFSHLYSNVAHQTLERNPSTSHYQNTSLSTCYHHRNHSKCLSQKVVVRIHKSCHIYLATCHTPRAEICLPENTATTTTKLKVSWHKDKFIVFLKA
jgi:hypothetical protein